MQINMLQSSNNLYIKCSCNGGYLYYCVLLHNDKVRKLCGVRNKLSPSISRYRQETTQEILNKFSYLILWGSFVWCHIPILVKIRKTTKITWRHVHTWMYFKCNLLNVNELQMFKTEYGSKWNTLYVKYTSINVRFSRQRKGLLCIHFLTCIFSTEQWSSKRKWRLSPWHSFWEHMQT
jgi:hypothetical protein